MSDHHLTTGSSLPPVDEAKLRLYSMRFCPYAQRTKLVLEHKNLSHETIFVNLKNKPNWLFERNPNGLVPVLEYRGHVIYESAVCNEFLEEAFPADGPRRLLPGCPFERAAARLLMLDMDKVARSMLAMLAVSGDSAEKRQEAVDTFHAQLRQLENKLEDKNKPFFAGSDYGVADLHLWPFIERVPAMAEIIEIDLLPPTMFPRLNAWKVAMERTEPVKRTKFSTETHKRFLLSYRAGDPQYDVQID